VRDVGSEADSELLPHVLGYEHQGMLSDQLFARVAGGGQQPLINSHDVRRVVVHHDCVLHRLQRGCKLAHTYRLLLFRDLHTQSPICVVSQPAAQHELDMPTWRYKPASGFGTQVPSKLSDSRVCRVVRVLQVLAAETFTSRG